MRNNGVLYGEGEIAWHTEDVGDVDVVEPARTYSMTVGVVVMGMSSGQKW
jgi:hypothetical protein